MFTSRISRKSRLQARARATFLIKARVIVDQERRIQKKNRAARRISREHPARSVLRARV